MILTNRLRADIVGKRINRPFYMGQGWTVVHLTIALTEKAWKRATKHLGEQVGPFPADLHASITHFDPVPSYAAHSVMTFNMEWAAKATKQQFAAIVAHEAMHYAQRVSQIQGDRLDTESEAYIIQLVTLMVCKKIDRFR
jgi:hypothetical protein